MKECGRSRNSHGRKLNTHSPASDLHLRQVTGHFGESPSFNHCHGERINRYPMRASPWQWDFSAEQARWVSMWLRLRPLITAHLMRHDSAWSKALAEESAGSPFTSSCTRCSGRLLLTTASTQTVTSMGARIDNHSITANCIGRAHGRSLSGSSDCERAPGSVINLRQSQRVARFAFAPA